MRKKTKSKRILFFITFGILLIIGIFSLLIFFRNKNDNKDYIIDVDKNVNIEEYLPFDDESKIARLDHEASLKLKNNLPVLDGKTSMFPVYSAFVNAVYPSDITISDYLNIGPVRFYNTVSGYRRITEGKTDIYFGFYPSDEQLEYAEKNQKISYMATQIGSDAFVFFVSVDNPVDNLTIDEIKKIYSGEITNWKEVGGKDEEIIAYQSDFNSETQSMFLSFMEDTSIMYPPMKNVTDGNNDYVACEYRNSPSSIGFAFRYNLNTLINNPKIKMISVNGVYPSANNIKNGTYELSIPLYAISKNDNINMNVYIFINWILSNEGQQIIEDSGYVGVS